MYKAVDRQRSVLILAVLLFGGILLGIAFLDYVEQPVFSHDSGFYEGSFSLSISAFHAEEIYYTLDGSTPGENSLKYTGPIRITDATQNENTYSMRTDVSVGFYTDLLGQGEGPGYTAPDFPVDKCTVVRAIAVSPGGSVSEITSASYFVDVRPEDYHGCNILSLITDPGSLFDSQTGIYVTGDAFDEYLEGGNLSASWWFCPANYRQRGKAWERPVTMEFFSRGGEALYRTDGGMRIHGGASRAFLPRSVNLYADTGKAASRGIDFPIFGDSYRPKAITLNSGGNQTITQFPDYMMSQMAAELNFSQMQFEPYVLFLNGEYWGFYWLSEKYDEEYLAHHYQVRADDVVMIKNGEVEAGEYEDIGLYIDMQSDICQNDMSDEENYQWACEMIDMDSCIDYYAALIYLARCGDWPSSNFALWRTRNVTDTDSCADGRWRWMLFDCNSTCMRDIDYEGACLTEADTLSYVLESDAVFASLWNSESFRQAFTSRILQLGQTCFSPDKMDAFIQDYMDTMAPVLEQSWARFYGSRNEKYAEFCATMEQYRAFFEKRPAVVEGWFR